MNTTMFVFAAICYCCRVRLGLKVSIYTVTVLLQILQMLLAVDNGELHRIKGKKLSDVTFQGYYDYLWVIASLLCSHC